MSALRSEDSRKWIFSFVAIIALIVAYVTIKFLGQMSEWFDLEAKIGNFVLVSQVVGIAAGFSTFMIITKNHKTANVLQEVYSELVKVIWPDKDGVTKLTVGIIIGLVVASGLFLTIDLIFKKLLDLIY
jgi:preprotein translocase subunit SecE